MSIEPALISFAGLTSLTAAMPKHRSRLSLGAAASPQAVRILGWTLLTIAAATAIARAGPAFGVVAWIGQLSLAGALLVLLMSWRPSYAPMVAVLALACALLLALQSTTISTVIVSVFVPFAAGDDASAAHLTLGPARNPVRQRGPLHATNRLRRCQTQHHRLPLQCRERATSGPWVRARKWTFAQRQICRQITWWRAWAQNH